MTRWLIASCACIPLVGALAADEQHRQLGAHEHGHGAFNVAIDGRRVSMELEAPGADIVAFEHKPTTKRQET
ncbi:MAG: ZrgA family zinc uptake protein, partial [Hyphomicrobiaceae bacterium]